MNSTSFDFVPEDPACGGHTVWLARRQQDG